MKLPKFFPKQIQAYIDSNKPTYYDLEGKPIQKQQQKKQEVILDSDTTATLPTIKELEQKEVHIKELIKEAETEKEKLHTGYCVKCKSKQPIHDIAIDDKETKKGIKRFIKGKCNICNGNVCTIAKRI